jgi:AraC-like DNA-binding protein
MPPAQPILIPACFVTPLVSGLRFHGEAAEPLLSAIGIDPAMPFDTEHNVTVEQYADLIRHIIVARSDEGVGFFSRKLKFGSFALVARHALQSATLAAALERFSSAFALLQDDLEMVPVKGERLSGFELRPVTDLARALPFGQEVLLRFTWRYLAWLQGGRLPASKVELTIQPPSYAPLYARVFPMDIKFGAASSSLWFAREALEAPVRRDEAALKMYLRMAIIETLVPCLPSRISDRVRNYLRDNQAEWPDLERTASALNLSASSLQRHLAQDGTSFQALRDQLRRDWAIYRLRTSKLSTLAIADELGFSDAATFQRAFKRWTGTTPAATRRGKQAL